jgi:hypothetical protein
MKCDVCAIARPRRISPSEPTVSDWSDFGCSTPARSHCRLRLAAFAGRSARLGQSGARNSSSAAFILRFARRLGCLFPVASVALECSTGVDRVTRADSLLILGTGASSITKRPPGTRTSNAEYYRSHAGRCSSRDTTASNTRLLRRTDGHPPPWRCTRSSPRSCGTTPRQKFGTPRRDCSRPAMNDTRSCTCSPVPSWTRSGAPCTTSARMTASVTSPRCTRSPAPVSANAAPQRRPSATTPGSRLAGWRRRHAAPIDVLADQTARTIRRVSRTCPLVVGK